MMCGPLSGRTYYVDAEKGRDSRSGLSARKAWKSLEKVNKTILKPGDAVRLKSGSVWHRQLYPQGSGKSGQPIVIDKYGKGEKPVLNGLGAPFVIKLENQEYWDIRNLEITNFNPDDSVSFKIGILIIAHDFGTVNSLHFSNLDIHHINGNIHPGDDASSKNNGGIFFEISGNKTKTWFDDILIENCYLYNIGRTGISIQSSWDKRTLDSNLTWIPSVNVKIRNNHFERISGNGLIWRVSHKPIVEYNVFYQCGLHLSGNAMFFFNCDSALGQNNEAYGTVYEPCESDASGFDADYRCKNTVFQYNYSHDNGSGAFVVCTNGGSSTAFQDGAVYRYNISQNENREVFHLSGPLTNTKIYNNVIFLSEEKDSVKVIYHKSWGGYPDNTHYYNNVFYLLSPHVSYKLGKSTNNIFDANVFYGTHSLDEPEDFNKMVTDPGFINVGSGAIGRKTLEGYQLKPDSPSIDSGREISDNGDQDFWGNSLYKYKPDRGVHER